jgi:prepilin-type N-terminal cleavage/methylation domain-containing protein
MPRSRRRRFSLIELLVVIAVISLLVAMTAPALTKAKSKASGSACVNNLHQISLMTLDYSHNFNEYFPTMAIAPEWAKADTAGHYGWTYLLAQNSQENCDSLKPVFKCPREEKREYSYSLNVWPLHTENASPYVCWHASQFAKASVPTGKIVLVEESSEDAGFSVTDCDQDNFTYDASLVDFRRHCGAGILFADLHVGSLRFFDTDQATYFTDKMQGHTN